MLPRSENYRIYPSVVPADKTVSMIIAPTERAFLLHKDFKYTVILTPVDADEVNYHSSTCRTTLEVEAIDGIIRFDYTFPAEQEHHVQLMRDDVKLATFYIFSLYSDLYSLRPMRGDLHVHSFRSDGSRDPAALAGYYREQGYDFFALTDHNRFYPGGEIDEVYAGVDTGLLRIPGEEVHTPGSMIHIVHVGGNESVTYKYVSDTDKYKSEVSELINDLPEGLPEQYRDRYAMAKWATDNIHKAGGLAIFPHPFWRPAGLIHNVNAELSSILLRSGMFDAYEVIGGMSRSENNESLNLWNELRANGLKMNVVGSSDVHGLDKSIHFPCNFTICFARENTVGGVIDALRNGLSVAVESTGIEYSREFRAYGALRLVTYAQYLLKHYFIRQEMLCAGVGVAMRAFAMGECSAELIELGSRLVEEHRARFFGAAEPILPDAKMIDFENRWRATHIEKGPITKGSRIDAPSNMQI